MQLPGEMVTANCDVMNDQTLIWLTSTATLFNTKINTWLFWKSRFIAAGCRSTYSMKPFKLTSLQTPRLYTAFYGWMQNIKKNSAVGITVPKW